MTKASDQPLKWTARLARFGARLPAWAKVTGGLVQGSMSATAAIIAYLPTRLLGLHEGFWGSITAIAVVQNELLATQTSARDQFAGAAVGGLVSAVIVALYGQGLVAYAIAIIVSMLACWLFNIKSAARLSGSTATIIMLVPHQGAAGWMLASRVAEVGWGVTVGVATVWLVNRLENAVSGKAD